MKYSNMLKFNVFNILFIFFHKLVTYKPIHQIIMRNSKLKNGQKLSRESQRHIVGGGPVTTCSGICYTNYLSDGAGRCIAPPCTNYGTESQGQCCY